MPNQNNKRCMACKVTGGVSNPSAAVLERHPEVRKAVTSKHSDGRVLTLDAVADKIAEKMMTHDIPFVCDDLKKQKEEGATVSFEHWVKNGLEVNLTCFGTCVVGKTFVLTTAKLSDKSIIPDDWNEELENDAAFPMVNTRTLEMKEGCSADEKENEHMRMTVEAEV